MTEVDAGQGDAAQDERRDAAGQVHALGEAAGGHRAAVSGLRQRVGQGVAADASTVPAQRSLASGRPGRRARRGR